MQGHGDKWPRDQGSARDKFQAHGIVAPWLRRVQEQPVPDHDDIGLPGRERSIDIGR